MKKSSWWGKLLRILGIVFMSLTAAFTLMGGAGTTCVALNPTGYEGKFSGIAPYQWLYILFVLVTVAIGVMGVRSVVLLCQAKKNAYRFSMITLVAGILVGGIHIFASRSLRGSSMPVDMVVYTTLVTFILFLIFLIPAISKQVDLEKNSTNNDSGKNAASYALAAVGLLAFTIQFIMAPTHTISGVNYADVWHIALSVIGAVLIVSACFLFISKKQTSRKVQLLTTKLEH